MKIVDFILCDDIRKEVGNKSSLIGVFDQDIKLLVPDESAKKIWPKPMRIGIFMRVLVENDDQIPDKFEVQFLYNDKLFGGGGAAVMPTINRLKLINFALQHPQFPILGEGHVRFLLKLYKDNQLIYELSPDYKMNISCVIGDPAGA